MIKKIKSVIHQFQYFFSGRTSNAQHGEDMLLASLLEGKKKGFYVDIGAHHPFRFSNTLYFYKRGWSGINIDAQPGSMKWFRLFRRRDINLEVGVGLEKGNLKFYSFKEPAFNTFSDHLVNNKEFLAKVPLKAVYDVPVFTLADIFTQNLVKGTCIDFMSIDVEGFDLDVLKSNDWALYRPKYLVVEESMDLRGSRTEKEDYLLTKQYKLILRAMISSIYQDELQIQKDQTE